MVSRLFLGYAVVELAVLLALAWKIGLGWTLLLLLGTFLVGVALAGSQAKRQLIRLRSGLTASGGAAPPQAGGGRRLWGRAPSLWGSVTDGALVALGTVLVVIPGLVTSAAGLLLLLPPTRAVARPLLASMAARGIGQPLITVATTGADRYPPSRARARDDFIDGEVLDVTDVTDVEPAALPPALPLKPE